MKTTLQFLTLRPAAILVALSILPACSLFARDEFTMDSARTAAAAGDPKAEFFLGQHYANGKGVPRDYAKAFEYLSQSANQGYAPAQTALGSCYALGDGVPRNYAQAVGWYRKAAAQADPLGEYCLGYACAHGKGVSEDMDAALDWWQKAAAQGQVNAENALGMFYFHGEYAGDRSHVNFAEAAKWFRKAAEQGYPPAMSQLGYMYQYGIGVGQNWAEALNWNRRGANLGDGTAEDDLGQMYESGDGGLPMDKVQAYKWFLLSQAHGCPFGHHDCIEVELDHMLTPAQMDEARRMTNAPTTTSANDSVGAAKKAQE
jgi:TPR repeat protein